MENSTPSELQHDVPAPLASSATKSRQTEIPKETDRSRFSFKHPWFEGHIPVWRVLTAHLRNKKLRCLELGSFEGCSTTWILDNLMDHPDSSITAIDHFEGGMEHQDITDNLYELPSLEARFISNVSECEHFEKLRMIKASTEDGLLQLQNEKAKFDFIYIDASHVAFDVLRDAVLCWSMLEVGGTLLFDDVLWREYEEHFYNPRLGIMAFVQCVQPEIKIVEASWQLWITRVPNNTPPTTMPGGQTPYSRDALCPKCMINDKQLAVDNGLYEPT